MGLHTVSHQSVRGVREATTRGGVAMKRRYWIGTVVFILLGIATLIPVPASKPSFLGYYAHCSFTPISTIICWGIAGIVYWLGRKKAK